jgi:hypothetical protein
MNLKSQRRHSRKSRKGLILRQKPSFPIGPTHSKTLDSTKVKSFLIGPTHSKTLDSTKVKSFPIRPTHSKTLQFDAIEDDERRKKGSTSPLTDERSNARDPLILPDRTNSLQNIGFDKGQILPDQSGKATWRSHTNSLQNIAIRRH